MGKPLTADILRVVTWNKPSTWPDGAVFRVGIWLVGSAVAAVVTLASPLIQIRDSPHSTVGLVDVLSKGDLYIVALTITIAGVVELGVSHDVVRMERRTGWAFAMALASVVVVGFAAFRYADGVTKIDQARQANISIQEVFDLPAFAHDSMWAFLASLFLSSFCVSLTRETPPEKTEVSV
jgi:hypothetical protein